MSTTRFQQLCSYIRFDEQGTRTTRIGQSNDKLEAIRLVVDLFTKACVGNYKPGLQPTVDERVATFRGKCPFRVYMKSKPGRYGIKIRVCADASTAYICNLQVYVGMLNKQREENKGFRVVIDLVKPYFHTGRSVTTNNFFTSIPLATVLLAKKYSHRNT